MAIAFVIYLPAIPGGFIWDDNLLITENPLVTAAGGPGAIWAARDTMDYTPLTITTFWLEWRLWAGSPVGFHIVNLLLHAGAAVLIWLILEMLAVPGAWLGALLFCIHPVNAASVAWIAERKNTLSLFFYLLAIWWFLHFLKTRRAQPYALSLFAAVCAFLSKGSTVILPVTLVACGWWLEKGTSWRTVRSTLPFFALAAIAAVVTVQYQSGIGATLAGSASMPYRIVRAGEVIWFYLWTDLAPVGLTPLYPKWPIQPGNPLAWVPALLAAGCAGLFWWKRDGWGRPWLFAFGYFLLALSPVMGLVNMTFMDQAHAADWWQEIAITGPLALLGAGVARAWSKLDKQRQPLLAAGVILMALTLCTLTWGEAATYSSPEVYWRHALAHNPGSWQVHDNLGNVLAEQGRYQEASSEYEQAIRLSQAYPMPYYNLGNTLRRLGRGKDAIPLYKKALQIRPGYNEAYNNLGVTYEDLGQLDAAMAEFRAAIASNPGYAEAHGNLAGVLQARGQTQQAIDEYEKALAINPAKRLLRRNLENLLSLRDHPGEDALEKAQAVVDAQHSDPDAVEALVAELEQRHMYKEAAGVYAKALAQRPEDAHLLANSAWLLATCPDPSVRDGARGIDLATHAIQLGGRKDATILNPLAASYAEAGRFPEAIATAHEAQKLAEEGGNNELKDLITQELAAFAKQTAFTYQ